MSSYDKLLFQILRGTSDANIPFNDLRHLLTRIVEKINLQREGSKAKVYQVRQVRTVILKYKLGDEI